MGTRALSRACRTIWSSANAIVQCMPCSELWMLMQVRIRFSFHIEAQGFTLSSTLFQTNERRDSFSKQSQKQYKTKISILRQTNTKIFRIGRITKSKNVKHVWAVHETSSTFEWVNDTLENTKCVWLLAYIVVVVEWWNSVVAEETLAN